MTRGPRSTLASVARRLGAAAALAVLVAGGTVAVPQAARAGGVTYTMSCDDWWSGTSTLVGDDYGETTRFRSRATSCGSHYAWVNVYYANSSGSGSTGKRQSSSQAQVGDPVTLRYYRNGVYKSWHSGCGSGCYSAWSYA
ncbi:hypothetical protein [Glycomyces niveus]|uniref:Uncharacterized protein n=1 Tax=Glycomyces niveus TaxID=2820287 RepID=A0ABS3UA71_9ACTN|nr:hypothetical protein [Glycomyces sp. NEAU-S30]MBO3735675.1 hypothetical protein [Glycomyces sp. NEAU-S30]